MINNPGIQNTALLAWNGSASFPRRIANHVDFGFVFETRADLTADAVFVVQFHDADETGECVPGDGVDASENPVCKPDGFVQGPATFRIPSGTPAGTIFSGTVPCRQGKFISLRHVSGGANVWATVILQGPKRPV